MMYKILKSVRTKHFVRRGLVVGKNFNMESRVHIDPGFAWLVKIGDNVTLAPEVMILAHDASMKKYLGIGEIGKVRIGDNVFVGAKSIILNGVTIGNNVIIGAGSIVTKDIPDNCIACGNPAKVIKTMNEFVGKKKTEYDNGKKVSRAEVVIARKDKRCRNKISNKIANKAYVKRGENEEK